MIDPRLELLQLATISTASGYDLSMLRLSSNTKSYVLSFVAAMDKYLSRYVALDNSDPSAVPPVLYDSTREAWATQVFSDWVATQTDFLCDLRTILATDPMSAVPQALAVTDFLNLVPAQLRVVDLAFPTRFRGLMECYIYNAPVSEAVVNSNDISSLCDHLLDFGDVTTHVTPISQAPGAAHIQIDGVDKFSMINAAYIYYTNYAGTHHLASEEYMCVTSENLNPALTIFKAAIQLIARYQASHESTTTSAAAEMPNFVLPALRAAKITLNFCKTVTAAIILTTDEWSALNSF